MEKEFKINIFFDNEGIDLNNIIEKYLLSVIQSENSCNWYYLFLLLILFEKGML